MPGPLATDSKSTEVSEDAKPSATSEEARKPAVSPADTISPTEAAPHAPEHPVVPPVPTPVAVEAGKQEAVTERLEAAADAAPVDQPAVAHGHQPSSARERTDDSQLRAVVASAGMQWVETNHERHAAAQAAIAQVQPPVLGRERQRHDTTALNEPLEQVETRQQA